MQVCSRRRRTSAWLPWRISSEVRRAVDEGKTIILISRGVIRELKNFVMMKAHNGLGWVRTLTASAATLIHNERIKDPHQLLSPSQVPCAVSSTISSPDSL